MDAKLPMSNLLIVLYFMPEHKKYVVDSYGTYTIKHSESGCTTKVYRNGEYFEWFVRGEVETYIINGAMYLRSHITEKE